MERIAVTSSNIKSIGFQNNFDATELGTLEVEFRGGATYQYSNVPTRTHRELMESESKGKFMHANVRDKFATVRLEDVPAE